MINRKTFLKQSAFSAAGMLILPSSIVFAKSDAQKIKIGFIGTGLRGQDHVELALRRDDVEIVAICDIQQVMIDSTLELFNKAGKKAPIIIKGDQYGYRKLLNIKEIDAVIIATPWEWHYPMAIDALHAGKHVGCEVIAAESIAELWNLVKTVEQTGLNYMMLENVCYRRDVMAVMNMVKKGMFGEMVHLQGGYQHDLREVKFNDGKQPYGGGVEFGEKGFSEAQWRTQHSVDENGDLYPTHGIGPIAMMTNINRGNRFTSLVSYSSKTRGLHEYTVKNGGSNHPNAAVKFKLGDVVTTMLQTANQETILLQHDTSLPRPYSLGFRVQGTKGLWMDINQSLYIEGISKSPHRWEAAKPYLEQYDHPLWKKFENDTKGAGHGGMDFFVLHEFVEAIKRNKPTPLDVYDAACWTAITPLSKASIAKNGKSMVFPDFTKGGWKKRENGFGEQL
jgi:predicted dehydrogenase